MYWQDFAQLPCLITHTSHTATTRNGKISIRQGRCFRAATGCIVCTKTHGKWENQHQNGKLAAQPMATVLAPKHTENGKISIKKGNLPSSHRLHRLSRNTRKMGKPASRRVTCRSATSSTHSAGVEPKLTWRAVAFSRQHTQLLPGGVSLAYAS
jgi:hypothetical protein